jgi:hypothetical protein
MGRKCLCCGLSNCEGKTYTLWKGRLDSVCNEGSSGGQGLQEDIYLYPEREGYICLAYDAFSVPDRFMVYVGGQQVVDTGFVGAPNFGLDVTGPGAGSVSFFKPQGVTEVKVIVEAPLTGTGWTYTLSCLEIIETGTGSTDITFFAGTRKGCIDILPCLSVNSNTCSGANELLPLQFIFRDCDNLDKQPFATVNWTIDPNYIYHTTCNKFDGDVNNPKNYFTIYKPTNISKVCVTVTYPKGAYDIETSIDCPRTCTDDDPPPPPDDDDDSRDPNQPPDGGPGIPWNPDDPGQGGNVDNGGGFVPPGGRNGGWPPRNNGDFRRGWWGNNGTCFVNDYNNSDEPLSYLASIRTDTFFTKEPQWILFDLNRVAVINDAEARFIIKICFNPNAEKKPISRNIVIEGFDQNMQNPQELARRDITNSNQVEICECTTFTKPEGIVNIFVWIWEENPDGISEPLDILISRELEPDTLWQQPYHEVVWHNKGTQAGVVNFYASVHAVPDAFCECRGDFDNNPITSEDSAARARFIVEDVNNGNVYLDFELSSDTDDPNFPASCSDLNSNNSFNETLTEFFKEFDVRSIKVTVKYTRNTIFRYVLGCPRDMCLQHCPDYQGLPNSIKVTIEGSDYNMVLGPLGQQLTATFFRVGGPPLILWTEVGRPTDPFTDQRVLGKIQYYATVYFPGGSWNGEHVLTLNDSKTAYESNLAGLPFCDATDIVNGESKGSKMSLKLANGFSCGLFLENIKVFYRWGKTNNDMQCEVDINPCAGYVLAHSSYGDSWAISCDQLYKGQEVNVSWNLLGANRQSILDNNAFVNALGRGHRAFDPPLFLYDGRTDNSYPCLENNVTSATCGVGPSQYQPRYGWEWPYAYRWHYGCMRGCDNLFNDTYDRFRTVCSGFKEDFDVDNWINRCHLGNDGWDYNDPKTVPWDCLKPAPWFPWWNEETMGEKDLSNLEGTRRYLSNYVYEEGNPYLVIKKVEVIN